MSSASSNPRLSPAEEPPAASKNSGATSSWTDAVPKDRREETQESECPNIAADTIAATPDEGKVSEITAYDAGPQTVTSVSAAAGDADLIIEDLNVDSNSSDTDSAIEDMRPVSTTDSLSPSMYDHVVSYGRTYHKYKAGKYMLPNDETEQNRLDLQHHLFLLTLHGQLHLAPIKPDPHNVLDIGTGTGIWAIDFAIKYPSADVIGCDLSPIQPVYVPQNCRFEIDDVEDEWLYTQKFDYIHGRLMAPCFTNATAVFKMAFNALKPGGYFEMQDVLPLTFIDSSGENTQIFRWVNLILEAATKLGRDWAKVQRCKEWMEAAGFVDVKETRLAWPTNTWANSKHHKILGIWANADLKDGLEGFSMTALTKAVGWTPDEVKALLVDVKRDLDDRNIHAYVPVLVVYGRKPI